ncbi:TolC family protein [Hufsiella ginkgonis]|uniref:TolC family protein n=1 Tax=Hufsiella ginkgonis TaxID=2695274 RepID=A0A7K1XSQ4_9SPHI|nr:TolC family protein [Hufsiella ginkgonis]MXV14031.1 TolC family protein [Hufsiella ginkgonis]
MLILTYGRLWKFIFFSLFLGLCSLAELRAQERTLDFFLNQATKNSPLLRDLSGQQSALALDSILLRAQQRPQVKATSSGLYAPVIKGWGYDEALSNGQSLDALLGIDYVVMGKQRKNALFEALKIRGDSARYAVRITELDIRRSIAEQYIAAYASQQQALFSREVSALLGREDTILRTLTRANTYKQTDYLAFLVTFQQQKLAGRQAEISYKTDLATLYYLAGIADTITVPLSPPAFAETRPVSLPNSIFLQKFRLDSVRIEGERAAVDLAYKPQIGIFANAGYNSSFILQPYKNFGTSVGFSVSVPIYDGHQKRLQYSKLEIEDRTRAFYRDFFTVQQKQQIDLLNRQIAQTDQLFDEIGSQVRFAKGLVEADTRLLQTGDVTVADFIIAINGYMDAQNLYRQTVIDRLKLLNQLTYWNR